MGGLARLTMVNSRLLSVYLFTLIVLVSFTLLICESTTGGFAEAQDVPAQCAGSCPDKWRKRGWGEPLRCDAPKSYTGKCNINSKFPKDKYPTEKKIQWAQNCKVAWTACGYTQDMVDGVVESPHWQSFREDHDDL